MAYSDKHGSYDKVETLNYLATLDDEVLGDVFLYAKKLVTKKDKRKYVDKRIRDIRNT